MDFLAIGTLWFWVAAVIWLVIVTFCIEKEDSSGWGALLTSGAFLALLFFFGSKDPVVNVLHYVAQNPGAILGVVTLYLFFGIAWSIVKWWFFLRENKRKQKESLDDTNKYRNPDEKTLWKPTIPKACDNKSTILMWMSWWPFSLIWTLLDDPHQETFPGHIRLLGKDL